MPRSPVSVLHKNIHIKGDQKDRLSQHQQDQHRLSDGHTKYNQFRERSWKCQIQSRSNYQTDQFMAGPTRSTRQWCPGDLNPRTAQIPRGELKPSPNVQLNLLWRTSNDLWFFEAIYFQLVQQISVYKWRFWSKEIKWKITLYLK